MHIPGGLPGTCLFWTRVQNTLQATFHQIVDWIQGGVQNKHEWLGGGSKTSTSDLLEFLDFPRWGEYLIINMKLTWLENKNYDLREGQYLNWNL